MRARTVYYIFISLAPFKRAIKMEDQVGSWDGVQVGVTPASTSTSTSTRSATRARDIRCFRTSRK